MIRRHGQNGLNVVRLVALLLVTISTARCDKSAGPKTVKSVDTTLRVGIGGLPSLSADRGVQQFVSNISNEGLLRVNQEGRLEPWLAESWDQSTDGLSLTVRLRPRIKFHDGSPVDADVVATILNDSLPKTLRSTFEDVESISASGERDIRFRFRQPSSLVAESFIDIPIQKPGTQKVGTGPFLIAAAENAPKGSAAMIAFDDYYLGRPPIAKIAISTYPNTRAAWADMLRDQLDMLYEVGADAAEMMNRSKNVSLYAFDRPFQYLIVLNSNNLKLKPREVRQALNEAIDRAVVVRDGLRGHGTVSAGPVSPHHWAYSDIDSSFRYAPQSASAKVTKPFTIKFLAPAESPYEELALAVKQQLKAIGVNLEIDEIAPDQIAATLTRGDFEAVLLDPASGWSLLRAYRWWHSQGTQNISHFSSSAVDATLDRARHAANESEYRAAVAAFQRAISDDPPAIFLAWGDRSRAVSRRFDIQAQPGRDVIGTLRLWRPTADKGNTHN